MIRSFKISIFLIATIFTTVCQKAIASDIPESVIFTLYTNAPSEPSFRTYIATFDYSSSGGNYGASDNGKISMEADAYLNEKHCNEAAILFQWKWQQDTKGVASEPGVNKVRHWCEKGRFKRTN